MTAAAASPVPPDGDAPEAPAPGYPGAGPERAAGTYGVDDAPEDQPVTDPAEQTPPGEGPEAVSSADADIAPRPEPTTATTGISATAAATKADATTTTPATAAAAATAPVIAAPTTTSATAQADAPAAALVTPAAMKAAETAPPSSGSGAPTQPHGQGTGSEPAAAPASGAAETATAQPQSTPTPTPTSDDRLPALDDTEVETEVRTGAENPGGTSPENRNEAEAASDTGSAAGDGGEAEAEAPVDPERWLATYRPRLDPETLRESAADPVELSGIRDRLGEKIDAALDNRSRARLLSLRAVVSRLVGDLDRALDDGQLALTHAQATGELRRIAIAQARLAHVLRCRGDFEEADRLYAEANSPELPDRLRAALHEQMARSCYDQHRYIEACIHFERALDLRRTHDRELLARTEAALDGVFARVATRGWGPYARSRDEVLQKPVMPTPHFDAGLGRWGYADSTGELVIDSRYAEAQPFRDEVAWVRNPDAACWELIDRAGKVLIGADAGFREARAFSDELSWVRRADTAQWIAVDKTGEPAGPAGFDDVRPFRRGVAAVRRGRWGAVNSAGELVLAPSFDGFATALTDGRYLDGFTDEGLAVVEAAGRKGVVDRDGRMLVRPAHPAVVIHPVAFLIGDGRGRWGALDRRGDLLIEVVHDSRATVLQRIDRLLADTEPLL